MLEALKEVMMMTAMLVLYAIGRLIGMTVGDGE